MFAANRPWKKYAFKTNDHRIEKAVIVEAEQHKNDMETLGCGCVVVVLVLDAGEIGVGVMFHDDLVDVMTRSSERDMV